jgi:hypothetical protein
MDSTELCLILVSLLCVLCLCLVLVYRAPCVLFPHPSLSEGVGEITRCCQVPRCECMCCERSCVLRFAVCRLCRPRNQPHRASLVPRVPLGVCPSHISPCLHTHRHAAQLQLLRGLARRRPTRPTPSLPQPIGPRAGPPPCPAHRRTVHRLTGPPGSSRAPGSTRSRSRSACFLNGA